MCVTNTTSRRPVTLAAAQMSSTPSVLSQRLYSSLFGLESAVAASTGSTVPVHNDVKRAAPVPAAVDDSKSRDRRRERKRKPQKPGMTAKNNERHFVVHNYHDHARDRDQSMLEQGEKHRRRGGVSVAFPLKLHALLDQIEADGLASVISWQPHGRCFVIHDPQTFVDSVMPKYFRQTKLTSFQRQLNLYGFQRLTKGPDNGGYYHELFLRRKTFLCKFMNRIKVKGTGFKAASSPEDEPDFYRMPPVLVTPGHTSDDASGEDEDSIHSESTMNTNPAAIEPIPFFGVPLERPAFPSVAQNALIPEPTPIAPAFVPSYQEQVARHPYMDLVASSAPAPVSSSDEVLDEVVDELFLHESSQEENDNILDFIETWNPENALTNSEIAWYGVSIEDDAQLGRLLEKVLED